jgi:signal transduction histidine kinase
MITWQLGIPSAKLDRIFDEFVRAHADLDGELGTDGLGLGLSIVRESMDAMGGSVRVASVEGEGTTFTLEWPPAAVQGSSISQPASR